jgi:hypothetical protein
MRIVVMAAMAAVLQGCVSPSLLPRTSSMAMVSVDCRDGYQVQVDDKAKNILVVPFPASEAAYAVCAGSARKPIEARVAQAALRHIRRTFKQACEAGAVTSAGVGAYLVSFSGCRPLALDEV